MSADFFGGAIAIVAGAITIATALFHAKQMDTADLVSQHLIGAIFVAIGVAALYGATSTS